MKLSEVTFTKGYQLRAGAGQQSTYIVRASEGYAIELHPFGVIVSHPDMPEPRWIATNQCEGGKIEPTKAGK